MKSTWLPSSSGFTPFFCRSNYIGTEIGRALLELGEILNCLQSPLRPEQPLDIDPAQRHGLDTVTEPLRTRIGCEMGAAVLMPVRVAVEARCSLTGYCRLAVIRRVELLLREWREQEAQPE